MVLRVVVSIVVSPEKSCLGRHGGRDGGLGGGGLAAQLEDLVAGLEAFQGFKRRADRVGRVAAAHRLGQDVLDPARLENRAHSAAGEHARSRGRGLHPHLAGAVAADDLVRDGVVFNRKSDYAYDPRKANRFCQA